MISSDPPPDLFVNVQNKHWGIPGGEGKFGPDDAPQDGALNDPLDDLEDDPLDESPDDPPEDQQDDPQKRPQVNKKMTLLMIVRFTKR